MKIVFASGNLGKIQELKLALAHTSIHLIPQSDFNVTEVAETGLTFIENALIKARHAAAATGLPAIADDSGLEVAALHGAPGIYSARFSGDEATADENNQTLLAKMQHIPIGKRQARFYCALVYLAHAKDPTPIIAEASWSGEILLAPVGEKGFGYDPIFYDPIEKSSAAALDPQKKLAISHRGKALELFIQKLIHIL